MFTSSSVYLKILKKKEVLMAFTSNVFTTETVDFAGEQETIVRGGRNLFDKLAQGFGDIKKISVIGWSSQGPAQAQNLRDSLDGTDITVGVGLREGSSSFAKAETAGFSRDNETLGEMYDMISKSDMTILLISDAAQAENWQKITEAMKPGSTLGLSHGFLLGYVKSIGQSIRDDINIIGVCPKGMGPSVRRLYEQGKETEGAGINCSFAVEQDISGNSNEVALAWAVGLGAPFVFQTTLEMEYRSDIFGERGILLGGVHAMIEVLNRYFVREGRSAEQAFRDTAEVITGPLSQTISHDGLKAVYDDLNDDQQTELRRAYNASYEPFAAILDEIYTEVHSGREFGSVIDTVKRLEKFPLSNISNTEVWRVGEHVRKNRDENQAVDPTTAGFYLACMVAQVDLLKSKGHEWSEVVNESIIEAVDSLNPYMHAQGVAYMVDNCSMTAKLGSRKWAPQFDYRLEQQAITVLDGVRDEDNSPFERFENHDVHAAMKTASKLRPSVDISVV
jgi:ketol-acid reductoisomerase